VTAITSFLGWTPEQWTAARIWARRNGVAVPEKMFPDIFVHGPDEDVGPWHRLQSAWNRAGFSDKPSLDREMMLGTHQRID